MTPLNKYLSEYQLSHQNPINKRLHWLCIPLIMQSLVGMGMRVHVWFTLVAIFLALIYYIRLSLPLFFGMVFFFTLLILTALLIPISLSGFALIFALAWVGQFYGHKIEGKKPSFFTDLQFLLIGPAWCAMHLQQQFSRRFSRKGAVTTEH